MSIPAIESQSSAAIKEFQEGKLRELLHYLAAHSPFYQRAFAQAGVSVAAIQRLEDLVKLPVTTKHDLHRHPSDFLCVDPARIVDYVCTSGTLGQPVTFGLTDNDLDRLAYNEYLSLGCAGGGPGELYQLTTTLDKRFMAGLAYFLGARRLGAGIIRVGSGVPEMQWDTIQRLRPTAIIAVPSFVLKLIEYAEEHELDYAASSVRKVICIGENIRNPDFSLNTLGQRIHSKWDIALHSTYASTEMGTSFTECAAGQGGHHHPELLIVEVLDAHNHPVPDGEPGELTITTLGVEGMPLLRFKTGDVCAMHRTPCACGRTTTRLSPVLGRKQHLVKYKGTTLYPQLIHDALHEVSFVKNFQVESYTNDIGTDELLLHIGCHELPEHAKAHLREHLRAKLRIAPSLVFKPVAEVERLLFAGDSRKPRTFLDRRAA
ncbi:phenylacetate--CoA ligase family protein [Hymenobacter cavernae]|uniref:Phenylacetate--CoA ligase n=1 Tax=Hymenobacter cavernae TaxID=2044852 RepID=A0ABQ1TXC9_9BACT|nr:AMP-binding protein [Hymenobacter cavernae]GGF03847.1 phenylacetate--CoA ligase [Hymenobacter cavernae]